MRKIRKYTDEQIKKIWEIAERYNTSIPVSGNWETECDHELDTIQEELGLTRFEAELAMTNILGF